MFAVFKTGGKQYRVAAEDVLKVDKVKGEPGEIVEFGEVLVVGGDSVTLGAPDRRRRHRCGRGARPGARSKDHRVQEAPAKNSRRKRGHRQEFTLLRITEILTDGKKPSKTAPPRPKRAPAPAPLKPPTEPSRRTPRPGGRQGSQKAGKTGQGRKAERPRPASKGKSRRPKPKARRPRARKRSERKR
jgi:large subunit ribosomal protein L21